MNKPCDTPVQPGTWKRNPMTFSGTCCWIAPLPPATLHGLGRSQPFSGITSAFADTKAGFKALAKRIEMASKRTSCMQEMGIEQNVSTLKRAAGITLLNSPTPTFTILTTHFLLSSRKKKWMPSLRETYAWTQWILGNHLMGFPGRLRRVCFGVLYTLNMRKYPLGMWWKPIWSYSWYTKLKANGCTRCNIQTSVI